MPIFFSSQYGRVNIEIKAQKKHNVKVLIEEEHDKDEVKKVDSPPPSPHIIDKESITLFPDGEPNQNRLVNRNSDSENKSNDNQVL